MSGVVVQSGSRLCRVPLWLDAPAPVAVPGTVAAGYSFAVDWLNQFPPLALVGAGLVGGLLLRRAFKLAAAIPGVSWLLDLNEAA
jgi:hypothetical protein